MLTKLTIRGLRLFFKCQYGLRIGPYRWNENEPGVTVTRSRAQWLICDGFLLYMCWCCGLDVFCFLRAIIQKGGGRSITNRAMDYMLAQWYLAVVVFQYNALTQSENLAEFLNVFFKFNRDAAVYFLQTLHPVRRDGCEKLIWGMVIASFVNTIPSMTPFLADPLNSRFTYSWVTTEGIFSLFYMCWLPFEYYIWVSVWYPWLLSWFCIWIHTTSMTFWLQQIKFGGNKRFSDNPRNVILIFKRLQILDVLFNNCFSRLVFPAFVVSNIAMHVMCIFCALKFHADFPTLYYPVFPFWSLIWFFLEYKMYTMLGNVNFWSISFVQSWMDVVGVKSRKTLKAFPPLGIRVGSLYIVQRTTVMTLFLIISNFTIQSLLVH